MDKEKVESTIKNKNILIGISGSIAVAGIFPYLGMLRSNFKEVKVILTKSASQLIPAETIQYFCDEIFLTETPNLNTKTGHVELARWADLFIVLPATANTLSAAAHGIANQLLTTTILAYEGSIMFFPNMNRQMWEKNVVQRNVNILLEDGHSVISPKKTMAYEVASKSVKPNYVLPSYQEVMEHIYQEIAKREEVVI